MKLTSLPVFQLTTVIAKAMTKMARPTPIQPAPPARFTTEFAPGRPVVRRTCSIRTAKKISPAPPQRKA
ncbi:hypothetical protein D3C87_1887080 [compost metagenome]